MIKNCYLRSRNAEFVLKIIAVLDASPERIGELPLVQVSSRELPLKRSFYLQ